MAEENNAPILLKNCDPLGFEHESGWLFLILFLIPLFILWLGSKLFEPESFMSVVFMIIGVVIFLVIIVLYSADYKSTARYMKQIRYMRFKFTNHATLDDVFDELAPALKHIHGGKVKVTKKADCVLVTYKGVNYEVILNGDATFSVRWKKSFFDKILSFLAECADNEMEPLGKYEKIRTETPIIAYELQKSFGITVDS